MPKTYNRSVLVRMDDRLHELLVKVAEDEERPISQVIRMACETFAEANDWVACVYCDHPVRDSQAFTDSEGEPFDRECFNKCFNDEGERIPETVR